MPNEVLRRQQHLAKLWEPVGIPPRGEFDAKTPDETATRERQLREWSAEAITELTTLTEPLRESPTDRQPLSEAEAELAPRSADLPDVWR